MKRKNVVVIGGGTGTYTVLTGLKKYQVNLTAIVSMADDGGSNKTIRDEFGLLPTSDIRQCFVALSEGNGKSNQLLRKLFMYRFHQGKGIKGMNFGNLFMAALADILGSQKEAILRSGEILRIRGNVLPVTFTDSHLGAVYENGKRVVGEHLIDEPGFRGTWKIKNVFLTPPAKANPEAIAAIERADLIILGPGDLYTSLIPNLLVKGISSALQKTKAKLVYVLNLMTRPGQTMNFSAKDHVTVLEKYLGKRINWVLVNSKPLPSLIFKKYEKEGSAPVVNDLKQSYFKIIRGDFLQSEEIPVAKGDILKRSLIRHDSDTLAKALFSLL